MAAPIRLGVIGCGFFAQNHLHAWKDLAPEGVELVAVCDRDAGKAEAAATKFGVPHWYTDAAAMFAAEDLGLVDIATQMATHQALTDLAIARRVPTIVQKPFAPDLATCEAITAKAEAAGVFLAVHENFRFQAPLRKLAELMHTGTVGVPNWGRISFRTGYDIYAGQPYLRDEARFILLDMGVHVLDIARVLFGEVALVSAQTQRRNPLSAGEDTATMLLRHRSGAVTVVDCSYESRRLPDPFPETLIEIEADAGALALLPGRRIEITSAGRLTRIEADAPRLAWAEHPMHVVQESVLQTCRHLLASLRDGTPAATAAADNLKTFALAEAAYEAASSGRAVAPRH